MKSYILIVAILAAVCIIAVSGVYAYSIGQGVEQGKLYKATVGGKLTYTPLTSTWGFSDTNCVATQMTTADIGNWWDNLLPGWWWDSGNIKISVSMISAANKEYKIEQDMGTFYIWAQGETKTFDALIKNIDVDGAPYKFVATATEIGKGVVATFTIQNVPLPK